MEKPQQLAHKVMKLESSISLNHIDIYIYMYWLYKPVQLGEGFQLRGLIKTMFLFFWTTVNTSYFNVKTRVSGFWLLHINCMYISALGIIRITQFTCKGLACPVNKCLILPISRSTSVCWLNCYQTTRIGFMVMCGPLLISWFIIPSNYSYKMLQVS